MSRKKRVIIIISSVFAALIIAAIIILDFGSWQPLDLNKLNDLSRTTFIYDDEGNEVAALYNVVNRIPVPLSEVPEHVKNAFLAAEDNRFYSHFGIDVWRIGGAVVSNVKSGSYGQGASTITQQLVKLTHLTSEKTISRKAQEAVMAVQLETQLSKDEILEKYINTVYFGKGAYGIEAAANTYFNKPASELTLPEGALLAGIIKSPPKYSPHLNAEESVSRRNYILETMAENQYITDEQADSAKQELLVLDMKDDTAQAYGWYIDEALSEAAEALNITVDEILKDGYKIYTSLNSYCQTAADELFENHSYFPSNAADGTKAEAAMIAVNPDNGEIYCLVGGRSYETRRGLNRATQIKRQPGSTFKPVSVYAAAIDQLKMSPTTTIVDAERDYGGGYTPTNTGGSYYGEVTLRTALARSMNAAAVELATKTGVPAIRDYTERAGIELDKDDANLSMALGSLTYGASPAEMCAAYASLANGGSAVTPHTVRNIEDSSGHVVYKFSEDRARVMDERSAYMITSMLESAASWGTASELKTAGFPVAGKTGTVGMSGGGNRDAWSAAYTPSMSVVTWMGFDMPDSEHRLANSVSGSNQPTKLSAAFLYATRDISSSGAFDIPGGVKQVFIDTLALEEYGIIALASENTPKSRISSEVFYENQVPTSVSGLWETPGRLDVVDVSRDGSGKPEVRFIAIDSGADYVIRRDDGQESSEMAVLSAGAGEIVTWTDESASNDQRLSYTVTARHRAFQEEGVIVEGPASDAAVIEPQRARLFDWLNDAGDDDISVPEEYDPENRPLFG